MSLENVLVIFILSYGVIKLLDMIAMSIARRNFNKKMEEKLFEAMEKAKVEVIEKEKGEDK